MVEQSKTDSRGVEPRKLTPEEVIKSLNKTLAGNIKGGHYIMVDECLKGLEEYGAPKDPLEGLNLRIEARERYAQVVDKWEMLANEGFERELEQLKAEKSKLEQDSPKK